MADKTEDKQDYGTCTRAAFGGAVQGKPRGMRMSFDHPLRYAVFRRPGVGEVGEVFLFTLPAAHPGTQQPPETTQRFKVGPYAFIGIELVGERLRDLLAVRQVGMREDRVDSTHFRVLYLARDSATMAGLGAAVMVTFTSASSARATRRNMLREWPS